MYVEILRVARIHGAKGGKFVELFNAQGIACKYRGVKQRYDGTISCEFIPLNRYKARKVGATIWGVAIHSCLHWLEIRA